MKTEWPYIALYVVALLAGTVWVGIKTARFLKRVAERYDNFWRELGRMFAGNDQRQ